MDFLYDYIFLKKCLYNIFCRYKPPDQVAEIFRQGLVEGEKQVRGDENYDDGGWKMRI